jgi:DNA-binding XRE family transcriptional regulator
MRRRHLTEARQKKGWAAIDLGELLDVSEQRVYDVERGRYLPKLEEGELWALALGMDAAAAFPELFASERNRP